MMVEVYNDVAMWPCGAARSHASEAQAVIAEVKGAGCFRAFADGLRRISRRSRIPSYACRTSPCTLQDPWQGWTSIR